MSQRRRDVDRVWERLVTLVMESRGDWRKKMSEATGLPFSRVRALRRLDAGPLTVSALAESMSSDAPAATAAVNSLEDRGLVERTPHPDDRRAKLVSLTTAGRRTLAAARKVTEVAPDFFAKLPDEDVKSLARILDRVSRRE